MVQAHPTALIDPAAELAADVTVGPYSIIERGVKIGAGTRIGAFVTLGAELEVGRNVQVFNYACLGTASQDLKHRGEHSCVKIGDGAIIREFVTVNCGTREGSVTLIGAGAALLAYAHVAHECVIGEKAVLVNAATLGGEVHIGRGAIIGGLVGVHQFCRIGEYAIVGANSKVTQDIAPYLIADGHPARPFRHNKIGLRRNGFAEAEIAEIRRIYRLLLNRARTFSENLRRVEMEFPDSHRAAAILDFVRGGTRGLARPRPRRSMSGEISEEPLPETTTHHS